MTAVLLDEMLSGAIAEQLRTGGLDAAAVVENADLVGTSDEDLLAYALTEKRGLVTANIGDFAAIAADWRAAGRQHSGLAYVTSRAFPQDRSFVGAIVSSLLVLHAAGDLPPPGAEIFCAEPDPPVIADKRLQAIAPSVPLYSSLYRITARMLRRFVVSHPSGVTFRHFYGHC